MRFLALVLLAALAVPGFAQSTSGAEALRRLFEDGPQALSYTDQFRNALPPNQLAQVLSQIEGQLGKFRTVSGTTNPYTIVFENGTATTNIAIDDQGRIAGLRFTQLVPQAASMAEALEKIEALEGTTAYLITENGVPIARRNADRPLAVGSAFKLAVLAAVLDAVEASDLRWDQTVELREEWKSLPTGILQDWPVGTAVTIETLAILMISISDNTATDALIHTIGREAMERRASGSVPFLTTAEAFKLKNPQNSELLERYRAGSTSEKRRVLTQLADRPLPPPSLFSGGPVAQDIEWFLSVEQLCTLIERVSGLELMTVNPGVANPDNWRRIAYKGGSEPGIINLTTYLEAEDGTRYCVSVTNAREDAAVDEIAVFTAYQGILSTLD